MADPANQFDTTEDFDAVAAFDGDRMIASGPRAEVAALLAPRVRSGPHDIQVFDLTTGRVVDLDLRPGASPLAPTEPASVRPRGRPKLGVTAREVTLLPRHWEWLAAQPGGASAAVRRLVDQARRAGAETQDRRAAQEAAYRFLTTMAGDRAGYEDAMRALYAGDAARFEALAARWPSDVRDVGTRLAAPAFL